MASVPNEHHAFAALRVDRCQTCQFQHDRQSCKFPDGASLGDIIEEGRDNGQLEDRYRRQTEVNAESRFVSHEEPCVEAHDIIRALEWGGEIRGSQYHVDFFRIPR